MEEKIGMTELYAPYLRIREEVDAAVDEVIAQAAFINGPAVARFAEGLADYLGARHVVPCGNGTDALVLALTAAGVSPGDEVILPAFTFGATAQAVLLTGGTPVLADVDPATFNLDPASVERLVGPRTRAIVPVPLFGCCADMEAIMRLAAERKYRLETAIARLFASTARRIALDDKQLVTFRLFTRTRSEFANEIEVIRLILEPCLLLALSRRFAFAHRAHRFFENYIERVGMQRQKLAELFRYEIFHCGTDKRVTELGFGLTLELHILHLDRKHRGQPDAEVVAE